MPMGPVHAVLANPDLLTMVFPAEADSDDECEELFRLALVCRKFCAVALDILWNRVHDIHQLYCLFPRHIVYTDPENTKSFNRTPVSRDEWSTFEDYAWRIRTIYVSFPEDHDLYMVLGCHPSRHPFPHLTCLHWFSDVSSVSHASLMVCSTLVDISFHLHGDGPDGAMADTIQAVKETCTHLRQFTYFHDGEFVPISTAFETSLISLLRSSIYLHKISVPTNYRILDALALLPSLTRLFLTEPSKSIDNGWNTPHLPGQQSPDQTTFAALEWLHIWSNFTSIDSLHLFLESFRKIASKPRVHLKVRLDSPDPRSFAELPQHLYAALPPNLRIGLAVFCILRQDWDPEVIAPVHSWQSFSWLLASPHLRSLNLVHHSLEIDDIAFAQMAQKWPELQVLRLFSPPRSIGPHATFRGMVHLSLLPQLQILCMTIGPNCTIAPSLLYSHPVSTSPLGHLELRGEFPKADTLHIALFLSRHFPNLQTLQTPHAQPRSPWGEVHVRMTFFNQILPEIPNGRARLNSRL